jgi:hypothetical protein
MLAIAHAMTLSAKRSSLLVILAISLTPLAGCVIYLDHPLERTISGDVARADTGEPLTNASVAFLSDRKTCSLFAGGSAGIDATTLTDAKGHFENTARLADKVRLWVQDEEFAQMFTLPPFTNSNTMSGVILRISQRKAVLQGVAHGK